MYYFIKSWVRAGLQFFCRKVVISNRNVLNAKGLLLLACNHPNSFFDAVLLGALFKNPVHFLARGDAFKNPIAKKILTTLKAIPIYRLSEGKEYLALNDTAFERCNRILRDRGIVLIFSEGLCLNQWELRPLKKGSAKIAINAWKQEAISKAFRVLPVSLNYNSFTISIVTNTPKLLYMTKSILLPAIVSLLSLSILFSCEQKKEKKHKKKDKEEQATSKDQPQNVQDNNTTVDCDTSLWKYVYNRERLQVTDICKTVTGVIEESSADEDGDQHMLLKLDAGQEDLLTKKNTNKKQGDLVIEAVCANKTTLGKVGNTCNDYINKIQIPKLGEHVKVTGSLVIDTHNGWAEIHPITKIEILK